MTYDEEWYLNDEHPDAAEHRAFLGIDKKGQPFAAPAAALPPVRPRRKSALTSKDWEALGRVVGQLVVPEIKKLQDRIAELEARPIGLDYRGIWKRGCSYARSMGVTHQGSIWVAVKNYPTAEPGEPNSGWRLAVKKGRDAK